MNGEQLLTCNHNFRFNIQGRTFINMTGLTFRTIWYRILKFDNDTTLPGIPYTSIEGSKGLCAIFSSFICI